MAAQAYPTATAFLPPEHDFTALRAAAARCQGCPLYLNASQTVFGQGPEQAAVVAVGEQPGDQEDLRGAPFVGPAGQLLDRALAQAGLPREQVYVTNAVKHFKWESRGKRRLHKKPLDREVDACRPWLAAEVALVGPRVLVCLGVTAARGVLGRTVKLGDWRGSYQDTPWGMPVLMTLHPSAVLRIPDPVARDQAYQGLVADLERVRQDFLTLG
jgi:uracil-DNA glycosylase family protein